MKAIVVDQPGSPEVMRYVDVPMPVCQSSEVIVKVHAAGVNRCDLIQRDGSYTAPSTNLSTLGIELAGVIVACGDQVTKYSIGDKVFGYVNGGAYAEYCATDAGLLNPLPEHWSFAQGAAVAEAFQVAYEILFTECQLQKGQTVLAYGGASSLGIAMIQLVQQVNSQIIVTAGSSQKCDFCLSLGADDAIDYHQQDIIAKTQQVTANQGVDLIINSVGPSNITQDLACLKPDGTLMMISTLGGNAAMFDILPFMAKRVTMRSYNTRGRELAYQQQIVLRFQQYCLPLLKTEKMQMPIDSCFSIHEVVKAHEYIEANKNIGKVILIVSEEPCSGEA